MSALSRLVHRSLLAAALLGAARLVAASEPTPRPPLVIERIEIEGNRRTSREVVLGAIPLAPGDVADPAGILEAAEQLGKSTLFRSAKAHTRPGSEPGRVVVVFEVEESRPHLRFGAGFEDLSGWYLIPGELNLDNLTGRGEALRVGFRLGYRLASLDVGLRSRLPFGWRGHGELGLSVQALDRVYFLEGTEIDQRVAREPRVHGGLDVPLGARWTVTARAAYEHVDVDSSATVYQDREILGRSRGDPVPFESLPPGIQEDAGAQDQGRFQLALALDTRQGPDLTQRGVWGRLQTEAVASSREPFAGLDAEARAFFPVARGALLAGRVRAAAVTEGAPFFERHSLGGLYSVRGFPSQSLSPPEGDRALVVASAEARTLWVGTPERAIVTGLLFLDAGIGWGDAPNDRGTLEAGAGYGWRIGIPWIQQLGIDVGFPLTDSPVDEAFHVNVSLWWTF